MPVCFLQKLQRLCARAITRAADTAAPTRRDCKGSVYSGDVTSAGLPRAQMSRCIGSTRRHVHSRRCLTRSGALRRNSACNGERHERPNRHFIGSRLHASRRYVGLRKDSNWAFRFRGLAAESFSNPPSILRADYSRNYIVLR